jgi:hypothetical protein
MGKGKRYVAFTLVLSIVLPLILGIKDPTFIAIVLGAVWFAYTTVFFVMTFLTARRNLKKHIFFS